MTADTILAACARLVANIADPRERLARHVGLLEGEIRRLVPQRLPGYSFAADIEALGLVRIYPAACAADIVVQIGAAELGIGCLHPDIQVFVEAACERDADRCNDVAREAHADEVTL